MDAIHRMNDSIDSLLCGQIEHRGEGIGSSVDLLAPDPCDSQSGVRTGSVTKCPVRIGRVRVRLDSLTSAVLSHGGLARRYLW